MRRALVLAFLVAGARTAAAGPTAHAVAVSVKTYYAGIHQLTAKFTEDVTNQTFGTTKSTSGVVYVQRPGRARWDYASKKHFVIDGKHLWVVDVPNKQVIEKDLGATSLPAAVTFLYGKGDLEKENAIALDASGALELTPKQTQAAYAKVTLVVDGSGAVTETTVTDASGNTSHYTLTDVDTASPIKSSTFVVNPKKGALAKYRYVHP